MSARDFLHGILEQKQAEVRQARRRVPLAVLRGLAEQRTGRRPFFERLAAPGPQGANIIAEIKRASPSKGPIRPDLDPARQALAYEKGGAAAVSVLTDGPHFNGSPEDLKSARQAVGLPVLRKDFVVSDYQIYESAAMGADAVLLIVRAVPARFLRDALALCEELRMDALVEVHSEPELETASLAGTRLVGINNRDLSTFRTDIRNSIRMARLLDDGQVAVAESGIRDRRDIETLLGAGLSNFLIGESLVRSDDPEGHLRELMGMEKGMNVQHPTPNVQRPTEKREKG